MNELDGLTALDVDVSGALASIPFSELVATAPAADVLTKIRTEKAINDALAGLLKAAVTEFKQTYR